MNEEILDKGFRQKHERMGMRFLPLFPALNQFESTLMVPDKMAVHNENRTAEPN
jgi:hypothetical protein